MIATISWTKLELVKIALHECVKGDFEGGLRKLRQLKVLDKNDRLRPEISALVKESLQ